jgi:hypothetical protein
VLTVTGVAAGSSKGYNKLMLGQTLTAGNPRRQA